MFGTDVFYVCIVRRFFVYLGDKMIWNFMISYRCIYEEAFTDRLWHDEQVRDSPWEYMYIKAPYKNELYIYVCSSIESALQEGFDT